MKRLKNKVIKKTTATEVAKPSTRITNDTVREHREKVLAEGRKFKYPVQYSKHKLVINSILITLVTLVLLIIFVWWQLYPMQNTSQFFYRITQLVPIPVATVDGQWVRYSDYLVRFRSSEHYLQQEEPDSLNAKGAERQRDHLKRESMNRAQADAYAQKLAKQYGITVSDKEVDDLITQERESQQQKLSERAYESAVLQGFYGWSLDEYRGIVKNTLLKRKVAFEIDKNAKEKIDEINKRLQARGADFGKIAAEFSDDEMAETNKGDIGFVLADSQDPNGLIEAATKLEKGQTSGIIKGTDAYYIIKGTDKKDGQIRYSRIKVSLEQFDKNLEKLRKQGKIDEFIDIPESKINN